MLYRQKGKLYSTAGFSMIELLVVVVMIGVVAAIAAPSWQSFLDRQRMNEIRGELMSVLRDAQDEAQTLNQSRQVIFSAPSAPISVTVRNATATTGGVTKVLGSGNVGNNQFSLAASTPIIFDYNGRVNVPTPYVMKITKRGAPTPPAGQSPNQSCVVVTTLLGGIKSANDSLCDSF